MCTPTCNALIFCIDSKLKHFVIWPKSSRQWFFFYDTWTSYFLWYLLIFTIYYDTVFYDTFSFSIFLRYYFYRYFLHFFIFLWYLILWYLPFYVYVFVKVFFVSFKNLIFRAVMYHSLTSHTVPTNCCIRGWNPSNPSRTMNNSFEIFETSGGLRKGEAVWLEG